MLGVNIGASPQTKVWGGIGGTMNLLNRTAATLSGKAFLTLSLTAVLAACGQAPQSSNAVQLDTGIIGGTDSTGKEDFAKHTVILYDAKIGALCTASILSESIVVTAAHCVDDDASVLRIGFGTDMDSQDVIVQHVVAYQVSPIWAFRQNQEFNTGDIALVRFEGGLPPGYSKVNFLTDATKLSDNMDVLLAGFGASKVAMKQDPKTGQLAADHELAGKLRSVTTTMKNAKYSKSEFLIEASKGKSACHGDSGGPAYVKVDGQEILTGITSRGVDDAQDMCNVSAAYTSIPFYASWIVSTSKQLDALVVTAPTKVASH